MLFHLKHIFGLNNKKDKRVNTLNSVFFHITKMHTIRDINLKTQHPQHS
jgi:hypothetical protein